MTRKLRPEQKDALKFMRRRDSGALFADMGFGKTAVVLHFMAETTELPVLLVGPKRVIETVWDEESLLWPEAKDLRFQLINGRTPEIRLQQMSRRADVYMITPDLIAWLSDLKKLPILFRCLVVDESSLFKSSSSRRFKRLRRLAKDISRRFLLTGTPSPNGVQDLWSQMCLVDLGKRLGTSFTAFRNEFFFRTGFMGYQYEARKGAFEEVTELVADVCFRAEAPRSIDPIFFNFIKLDMPAKARKHYRELEVQAFTQIRGKHDISPQTAAVKIQKLRQAASGFVYDDEGEAHQLHDVKLDLLHEVILETSSPIMVLYQYRHELSALKKRFKQGKMFSPAIKNDWNKGKIPLMFLPISDSYGLNLQEGGHTIFVFTASYSAERMSQAFKRLDRPGQKHRVTVHWPLMRNTVDTVVKRTYFTREDRQLFFLKEIKRLADQLDF